MSRVSGSRDCHPADPVKPASDSSVQPVAVSHVDVLSPPSCVDSENKSHKTEIAARDAGLNPEEIKTQVSKVMDRSLQTRLRNTKRNFFFRRRVVDRQGDRRLLFESDDVVLVFRCASAGENRPPDHWFFKRKTGLMSEEKAMLSILQQGSDPVDMYGTFCDQRDLTFTETTADKYLLTLMDAIRFYLG